MRRAESRAAATLTALYEAHAADAFRYALHVTGRREDAEDVVQFVFLQAYRLLESGGDLVNPRAWLLTATKHRALNSLRARREMAVADIDPPASQRPEAELAESEALVEVRSTLWALPESQHHAFVLRHWSGLSQGEIAEVLSTTPAAVESLLVRARAALVDDREGETDCMAARRRLVEAREPTAEHRLHIDACHRCKTARARLLRASELAAALSLVPSPQLAHTLAAIVPGFAPSGAGVVAAAGGAGAAGGGAGAGAAGGGGLGGGAGVATVSAATKATVAAKVALATATAVVALGAAHPVRSAVAAAVLGRPAVAAPKTRIRPPAVTSAPSAHVGTDSAPAGAPPATDGRSGGSHGSAGRAHGGGKANAGAVAHGKANGRSAGHATAGAHGASPAAAATGSGGQPASAGKSASAGESAPAGKSDSAGKSGTAGSNGKAKGKSPSASSGSASSASKGGSASSGSASAGHGRSGDTGAGKKS